MKTLTAESVAETLKRPLYMVSVGELGTDTVELEENLRKALDIATSWNAILLLDEADIFMEERSTMDVERNAMVSIFLRLLEYYQGIMFLTTNRAKNIDKAFVSRISLCIKYNDLSHLDREQVWYNILSLYGADFTKIDVHSLASHEVNGRQIKNICRIANAISKYRNSELSTNSYLDIIKKTTII